MSVVHIIQVQFLANIPLVHRLYHLIILLYPLNEALIITACRHIRSEWFTSNQLICV